MNKNNIIKDAENDDKELILLQYLDYIKLMTIFNHCKSLSVDNSDGKITARVVEAPDGSCNLVIDENKISIFEKQTFNELFIVTGISLFEKCCKEWFTWGLRYSPTRLNFFSNKEIKISEIINSEDIKQTIIKKIIDKINFQNISTCKENFKNVFGVEIFENREESYKFEKYLNHRHIISHNCGYVDIAFIKKMGLIEEYIGTYVGLDEEDLENFGNLLHKITMELSYNLTSVVYGDLERNGV